MSMHTEFDKSSLLWVNAEIESTLTKANEALALYLSSADAANLKFAANYLHQAFGALDLVELTGVARFCEEIEQLIFAIERGDVDASGVNVAQRALADVMQYLHRLMAGMPNIPLSLFPTFREMAQARNVSVSGSELFYPQLMLDLPVGLPSKPLSGDSLSQQIKQQRTRYESGLLRWLKGQNTVTPVMAAALADLAKAQNASVPRTFWWTAAAVIDGLGSNRAHLDIETKQLLLRLNLQIRRLADGSTKVAERLFRDLLYILARMDSDSALAKGLANQFELSDLIPDAHDVISVETLASQQLARSLRDDIAHAKDLWSRVASGNQDKLVTVRQNLKQIATKSEALEIVGFAALWAGLSESLENSTAVDGLALEVATGLLLADNALLIYPNQADDFVDQVNALLARLADPAANLELPQLDEVSREAQERMLLGQLANEMRTNLAGIEEILDAYFRDANQRAGLNQIEPMLHQVQGALMMLDRSVAVDLCHECLLRISGYIETEEAPVQSHLEELAEALSALGFYVNDLSQGRDNDSPLKVILDRLKGEQPQQHTATPEVTAEALEAEPEAQGLVDAPKVSVVPEIAENKPLPVSEAAMDAELLEVYLEEAVEVLAAIAENLELLKRDALHHEAITTIRRSFHTLKGSGRMVGLFQLGEVAWSIEQVMNKWLQLEKPATPRLLSLLEQTHSSFVDWVEQLQLHGQVAVEASAIDAEAAALRLDAEEEPAAETLVEETASELSLSADSEDNADLQIGAVRVSPVLFGIFCDEAQKHLSAMQHGVAVLAETATVEPQFILAAHTFGGIASTAGFIPQGELSYSVEHALQQLGSTSSAHVGLFADAVNTLDVMLQQILQQQEPISAPDLIAKFAELQLLEAELTLSVDDETSDDELLEPQITNNEPVINPESLLELTQQLEEISLDLDVEVTTLLQAEAEAEAEAEAFLSILSESGSELVDQSQQATPSPINQLLAVDETREATQAQVELDSTLNDDIDEQLLPIFIEESEELLPLIGEDVRSLVQGDDPEAVFKRLKRTLHTVKGSARMSGAMRMGEAAHIMESRLIESLATDPTLGPRLEADYDVLLALFAELNQPKVASVSETEQVQASAAPVLPKLLAAADPDNKTVIRVKSELIDQLVNQAGEVAISRTRIESEMVALKSSLVDLTENVARLRAQLRELEIQAESQMQAREKEVQDMHREFDPLEFDRFSRLQEVTRFMAESVNDVATVQQHLLKNLDESSAALLAQSRMTKELQQSLMRVRMVPFSSVSERLYRLTRQAGKEVGKKVNLEVKGGRVDIDRGVLDKMISPFEHMLRNAIDHGLEDSEQRQQSGKPEFGEIQIEVRQEGNELVLLLKDDGRGLDVSRIRQKAIEKGLITTEQNLSDADVCQLIFEPGFSTATTVTQLSGRGIGMDVVKNEVSNLGGKIDVATIAGQGTTFTIHLPLTLAVAQVLLVKGGERLIAIPSVMVEQVQELKQEALVDLYKNQYQEWLGQRYRFAYLPRLLGDIEAVPEQKRYSTVVLLRSGAERIALHLDQLVKNQEVVVKPIGPQLARIPGVVGATVLGTGEIVLIMNPLALLAQSAQITSSVRQQVDQPVQAPQPTMPEQLATAPVVMVVDDSLTVRKITGRLLAREGFQVVTAKDGVDALQQLHDVKPAVMLVDIEMPRMDGFELTRNVRVADDTRNIPIIMITSRTADKHKKYAFDLGVNAYLGKPYQEDELLGMIRKFIADGLAS